MRDYLQVLKKQASNVFPACIVAMFLIMCGINPFASVGVSIAATFIVKAKYHPSDIIDMIFIVIGAASGMLLWLVSLIFNH